MAFLSSDQLDTTAEYEKTGDKYIITTIMTICTKSADNFKLHSLNLL